MVIESPEWGGWMAAEIDEFGVRLLPAERVVSGCYRVEFYEGEDSLWPGLRAVRLYVGKKYDWLGIIGFTIRLAIWRLSGRRILNPVHDPTKMFCSEFCMSVLKLSGVPGTESIDPASTSPADLRMFVMTSGKFKRAKSPFTTRKVSEV